MKKWLKITAEWVEDKCDIKPGDTYEDWEGFADAKKVYETAVKAWNATKMSGVARLDDPRFLLFLHHVYTGEW